MLFGLVSAMTSSTKGQACQSAASFSGAATVRGTSPASVLRLRTAGIAMTASPSQLGLRTTMGPLGLIPASVTTSF